MKRRDFLSTIATVPALGIVAGAQTPPRPAAARKGLKLGTVTYNIAKDWDLPTLIKNLTDVGLDGVSSGRRTSTAWRSRSLRPRERRCARDSRTRP